MPILNIHNTGTMLQTRFITSWRDRNLTLTLILTLNPAVLPVSQLNCTATDQQEFTNELFFRGRLFISILFFSPVDCLAPPEYNRHNQI